MQRYLKRIAIVLAAFLALAICFSWMFLQSSLFNGARSDILERVLSAQTGYNVVVDGTVRVTPGTTLKFDLSDVKIPIAGFPDSDLAHLDRLALEADAAGLIRGEIDFQSLDFSGLTVNVKKSADGRNNWYTDVPTAPASGTKENDVVSATVGKAFRAKKLLNYVLVRLEEVRAVHVFIDNEQTGFSFEFKLDKLGINRSEGDTRLKVTSRGTVNGVQFDVASDLTKDGPFRTHATFSDIEVTFEGTSFKDTDAYSGQIDVKTGEVGDILDILKLERSVNGSGQLSAKIEHDGATTKIGDLSSVVVLQSGRQIDLTGDVDDLEQVNGADLQFKVRMFPEGHPPDKAHRLADLQLTEVFVRVLGNGGAFTIEDTLVRTNAFEKTLGEFGPITIGSIKRTEQNKLAFSDVTLQAGPIDAPVLKVTGDMADALQFEEFDFAGSITAPASLLFAGANEEVADQFGELDATFALSDSAGYPQLTNLSMSAAKTDLWSLKAHSESGEEGDPLSLELDLALEIADTARFLGALGLKEVDVSPLGLTLRSTADTDGFDANLVFQAASSQIESVFTLDTTQAINDLTGKISSKEVVSGDIRKWLAGIKEIRNANVLSADAPSAQKDTNNEVPVQPLVIEKHEISLAEVLAQADVQPLVLPTSDQDVGDLFDPDSVLMHSKIDIKIDIEKITGAKSVSSLSSALVAEDGKARLGPLKLTLDGGFVNLTAGMDVVASPNLVSVTGSTGGWDLGRLLGVAGVDIDASGTLNGQFDLTGRHKSLDSFLTSMAGPVSFNMSNGHVATSLLELAGLGVLPWLFSKERRDKDTPIVCLSAPLNVRSGGVFFDRVVVETPKVQAVAKGSVNWRDDSISMRAEARPVGKPLSRSAWPVDISGRLSAPDISPQIGGSRSRRTDGASKMPAQRKPCVPDILQLIAE